MTLTDTAIAASAAVVLAPSYLTPVIVVACIAMLVLAAFDWLAGHV